MMQCRYCKRNITEAQEGVLFCPFCGMPLSSGTAPAQPEASGSMPDFLKILQAASAQPAAPDGPAEEPPENADAVSAFLHIPNAASAQTSSGNQPPRDGSGSIYTLTPAPPAGYRLRTKEPRREANQPEKPAAARKPAPQAPAVKKTEAKQTESAAGQRVGDTVPFGSYPQEQVTNGALLAALERMKKNWKSYGYFSKGKPADYMRYADLNYRGEKYRAVVIDAFRPFSTGLKASKFGFGGNSFQYGNGYHRGIVYYFRYSPLLWRVLDPEKGLVLCDKVIDAQPFQNSGDNTYEDSSVCLWLNGDFYENAFSKTEQKEIALSKANRKQKVMIVQGVFLLSEEEATATGFGFCGDGGKADEARAAQGTDYAACQGVTRFSSGCCGWMLRSPGKSPSYVQSANCFGQIGNDHLIWSNVGGVRPAFRFANGFPQKDR